MKVSTTDFSKVQCSHADPISETPMHLDNHCRATYDPNPSREIKAYRRYKGKLKDLYKPAFDIQSTAYRNEYSLL